MQLVRRGLSVVGALVFAVFAALQFNDPDAPVWIAFYSAAAIVCLLATVDRRLWPYALVVPVVGVVWGLSLLPTIMAQPVLWPAVFGPGGMAMAPGVEETREALGLLIAASWSLAVILWSRAAVLQP
jgi:hypothetical protein